LFFKANTKRQFEGKSNGRTINKMTATTGADGNPNQANEQLPVDDTKQQQQQHQSVQDDDNDDLIRFPLRFDQAADELDLCLLEAILVGLAGSTAEIPMSEGTPCQKDVTDAPASASAETVALDANGNQQQRQDAYFDPSWDRLLQEKTGRVVFSCNRKQGKVKNHIMDSMILDLSRDGSLWVDGHAYFPQCFRPPRFSSECTLLDRVEGNDRS
jgi:hypothetical protein